MSLFAVARVEVPCASLPYRSTQLLISLTPLTSPEAINVVRK